MAKPIRRRNSGLIYFAAALLGLAALAVVLKLANPLPSPSEFPPDPPIQPGSSSLAEATEALTAGRKDETGLFLLIEGVDAFAMRLAMARNAKKSIDAQYYIWENDLTGRMLLAELIAAADRGVRVRMLLDDNPTKGLDPMWAAVTAHPNISVRLFNPLTIRGFRPANYLFDFPRLNRRMHNKSFTIDGAVTLVGGRNVGDEYFGARDQGLFIDVDSLVIGKVVPDVIDGFERYWNCGSAYAAESVLAGIDPLPMDELRRPVYADRDKAEGYKAAVDEAIATLRLDKPEAFTWAPARLVIDDPLKALGKVEPKSLLWAQIQPLIQNAESSVDLVSGYFVPTSEGEQLLSNMSRRGIRVRAVTNSIQVTDVPVVHAGYIPYRTDLLAAGVALFEARPLGDSDKEMRKLSQTKFSGGGESVHAKTFAVDGRYFFLGSFNFDPRSALLNCEMGFIVDSPDLAINFSRVLDERLPSSAYAVSLGRDQRMTWTSEEKGTVTVVTTEPGTTIVSRTIISFLSFLPIKWLL